MRSEKEVTAMLDRELKALERWDNNIEATKIRGFRYDFDFMSELQRHKANTCQHIAILRSVLDG